MPLNRTHIQSAMSYKHIYCKHGFARCGWMIVHRSVSFSQKTVSSSYYLRFVLYFFSLCALNFVAGCDCCCCLLYLNEENKNRSRTRLFYRLCSFCGVVVACSRLIRYFSGKPHALCLFLFRGQSDKCVKTNAKYQKQKELWSYITTPETPTSFDERVRAIVCVRACEQIYKVFSWSLTISQSCRI